jgi:phosphohistidine phosphatase
LELYLIRHAEALEANEATPDAERPLTDEGIDKMRKGAKGLRKLLSGDSPPLDAILSSPLLRALETARIVAGEVNDNDEVVVCDFLGGDFEWGDLLSELERFAPTARVAVVGHEPTLDRLSGWLASGSTEVAIPLKKGSAICFRLEELGDKPRAELHWLLTPKQMRLMR